MQLFIYRQFPQLAIAFSALLFVPTHTSAQSIDSCMQAQGREAITVCENLIDQGTDAADVYYKLVSVLHQFDQPQEAANQLREGLKRYPGNSKLKTLQSLINSDSTEAERLAASARKNTASLNKAELKLACRVNNTMEGLVACQQYLRLTDDDGDRIRQRLAELEADLQENQIAQNPVTSPEPEVVAEEPTDVALVTTDPVPVPDAAPVSAPDSTPVVQAPTASQLARRRTVSQIQDLLNEFGFTAGIADGVPGSKTTSALQAFLDQSGNTNNASGTRFDDNTLRILQTERLRLNDAQRLLTESQRAADANDHKLALARLDAAQSNSSLFQSPSGYRQKLVSAQQQAVQSNEAMQAEALALAQEQAKAQEEARRAVAEQAAQLTVDSTPSVDTEDNANHTSDNPEFDQLMAQIRVLRGKLNQQQTATTQHLQDIRSRVNAALQVAR